MFEHRFGPRYESVKDPNGTWSIFDTFTSQTCEIGRHPVVRLRESDALEVLEILNAKPAQPTVH